MHAPGLSASALTDDHILDLLGRIAVEKLNVPADRVAALQLDTSLVEGLQLDSLMQVVLLADLEERFGFEFDDLAQERLAGITTVGDLVHVIREQASRGR